MIQNEIRYQVVCENCGQVWEPAVKTSLWWRAKKRDEKGYLDALWVSGTECGCIEPVVHPEAPFRVFGYDDMCHNYNIPCWSFLQAVKLFRKYDRSGDIVFIKGVSPKVEDRLTYGK